MKIYTRLMPKRNQVSFLVVLVILYGSISVHAQDAAPQIYARVSMFKCPDGKQLDYEKYVKETMKPGLVRMREKGQIFQWIFYKVHFTGANDEYNYVGVTYSIGWPNTEEVSVPSTLKEIDPKVDPAAVGDKLRQLRTLVRQLIVYRTEAVEAGPSVTTKFIRLGFMKVKPGKNADYLKAEKEDWMPLHRSLVNGGQSSGWALWQVVFPGGTDSPYDYVTSSRYSAYSQIPVADYENIFKKVSPSKNVSDIFNRTTESRDLVKSELWEVIDMLQ